jgi:cell division protein FtsW
MTYAPTMSRADRSPLSQWWWTVDRLALILALCLMAAGLVFAFASSTAAANRLDIANPFYFVTRQAVFILIAASVMTALSLLSPTGVRRFAIIGYGLMVVVMVAIIFGGHEAKGAQRWLKFGSFTFQPSEILKPCLIILAAWMFAERAGRPGFPGARIAMALFIVPACLLIAQPDVGQTFLLTISFLIVFFVAGMPWIWIAGFAIIAVLGGAALYMTLPHVAKRVNGFLNPGGEENYQIERALDAIASGGIFGRGPGEGEVKALLPDSHTDFIYAVASEEFGLLAGVGLIVLFAFLIVRGLAAAAKQTDAYSQLAATGLFSLLGCQVAINIAVNLHLIPPKGMTLPFISYGGSSLLGSAITIGLALALIMRRPGASLTPGQ